MMHMGFGMGFGLMSSVFPILFTVMFVFIIGAFIVTIVRGIGQWHRNNQSPVLTVQAQVAAKRTRVSRHRSGNSMHYHSSTHYYTTFEVDSGDRMELHLSGQEYGLLAEGDRGKLTFQGTRYLGFERDLNTSESVFH